MTFHFQNGDRPLEGFTIQRGVGRGGFGEVYHALSDGGKEVALKYLRDNAQVELRGVMHCLNLKSPHLITLYDVKQNAAGEWFVIMEYVSGASLRDLLLSDPRGLGVEKAAYFLREIGKGLAYLHGRGIVHRDLKPGNIFFDEGYVKIGDYGLSKAIAASRHSGQTMSVGTVHYMAPEIGSGEYNKTIDIYALGVMLYEMLLGRVPFEGATMGEILMKHLTAQPEVDELPAPFPGVIRKALAKDPAQRYQDVEDMIADVMGNAELQRSVAGIDSLSLTRLAQRATAAVPAAVGVGGRVGGGSSNTLTLDARVVRPPVIAAGGNVVVRTSPAAHDAVVARAEACGAPFPPRNRWVAGILGVTLGPIGAHRFYLGYNLIGVLQFLSCFSGIGALWGLIEGIIILANGQIRDVYGRPLVGGAIPVDQPATGRSAAGKVLWGLAAGVSGVAALIFAGGGTFAGPDMAELSMGLTGETYYFNTFRCMYLLSSALGGFCCFAIWKAVHRAGLSPWRATIRPGLMCAMLALAGFGLTFELAIAAERMQLIGIIAVVVAMLVFTGLWLLRGPAPPAHPDDHYWNGAWMRNFQIMAALSVVLIVSAVALWRGGAGGEMSAVQSSHCVPFEEVVVRSTGETYRVPVVWYRHEPLGALAGGLLLIGSLSEIAVRRRAIRSGADSAPQQHA